jgi:rubrerythrin
MDKTKEILKGLQTAIEAELTGHEFYKNAAKSTSDPKGKETFERMSNEELGHFHFLRHQYKSVMDNGEFDLARKLDHKELSHSSNPVFSNAIKNRLKDAHFEISALTIGVKLELDAMNYYRSCAKNSENKDVRKFFNELADWEEDHFLAFEKQLEVLKQEYFTANNFVPM